MNLTQLHTPCSPCRLFVPGGRWLALLLLIPLWLGVLASTGEAKNGGLIHVPAVRMSPTGPVPVYSKMSGLLVQVDTTWLGSHGYRPVVVTVSSAAPSTADIQVTIRLEVKSWNFVSQGISVEHDFEVPLGSTSTSSTFLIPQYNDWNHATFEIWVDGVKDDQLCLLGSGVNSGVSGDVAVGGLQLGNQNGLGGVGLLQGVIEGVTGNSVDDHTFDIAGLPGQWLAYTSMDVLSTDLYSLELLRVGSPEKLKALLRWVRTGGNLWVRDVGQEFSKLPKLEEILRYGVGGGAGVTNSEDVKPGGADLKHWHFLEPDETAQSRLNDLVQLTMTPAAEEPAMTSTNGEKRSRGFWQQDSSRVFKARSLGFGTVTVFHDSRRGSELELFRGSSLALNLDWATRHGNDPSTGNADFNNLLIPDVGAAPVFEFQMLITLFVLGIGPLNYWLLKRRNQLPLLVVTVPVAALAATLMLFAYGVLADGVGVRVRARTVTMLDQQAGETASWAWLSYYAGVAPSDGLQMPADTALYPVSPPRYYYGGLGQSNRAHEWAIEWADPQKPDPQRLTQGWLASRTPTQYLALTARSTKKHLKLQVQQDEMTVANHLGTEVVALFVQDQEGKIFVGDSVNVDGTAKLTPSTYLKAAGKLRRLLAENLPQPPPGFAVDGNSNRGLYPEYNLSMQSGLMELQLEAMVSPLAKGWKNRTYIAVTASGIEVPLGLGDVTESSSFHLVRGTW